MGINNTISNFIGYRVFYLPVRGPYSEIVTSNRRKRQSAQAGELAMDFTGTTGTLANLNGSVTYRIQVAAVTTFSDDEVIGDRSAETYETTLEGCKQIIYSIDSVSMIRHYSTFYATKPESCKF